jgi:probable rRNA maturation factor
MKVVIQVATPQHKDLPSKNFIKQVLTSADLYLKKNTPEVLVRIVTPDEIQTLNATYRHKDYATNVLSFPFQAPPGIDAPFLGDIIICHQVLKTEAESQNKTLLDHYAHMLIHGFLHLHGYDHIRQNDAQIMENLEKIILQQLNIANPYEEIL